MEMKPQGFNRIQTRSGFTLIEILIVVMVLGILAMAIIPQISVSTKDARESTLSTNLLGLRNAVELYYHQHNNTYPGARKSDGSAAVASAAEGAAAFLAQLTQYSDATGKVSVTKDDTFKFGPYLKASTLPTNPFNDKNDVLCDTDETDITEKASDGTTAWKFYVLTGILLANDGAHDTL